MLHVGFDTPQRTKARLLNQRCTLVTEILGDYWQTRWLSRRRCSSAVVSKPPVERQPLKTKIIVIILVFLVILALLFYFAYDSNAGGFFRTATPTASRTNTPTTTSTSTPTFTPTMTPTATITPTATQTPTYTPTSTNTPVPPPPTQKPKDDNDGGGESCPPGWSGTPPECEKNETN